MEAINEFLKGAVSDPDYLKRGDGVWTFPTANIRVINKEGQGFIVTPMDGVTESFALDEGYVPVGGIDFDGIAYIASYNANLNLGQLGTYPSPNYDDQIAGASPLFIEEYQPLRNLESDEFTTSRFNWDITTQVRFVVRKSFDNSLDLYLADNVNPNLAINNGFNVDTAATIAFRQYTLQDFDGPIHHIPSTINIPIIDFGYTLNGIEYPGIDYGGRLEPGNYTIFIRLLTKDYARTSFVEWIGPIVIADGNTASSISGVTERVWKTGQQKTVNKKINLKIRTAALQGYEFFEIGVLRKSADSENGDGIEYCYLISKYWPIESIFSYVTINGTEKRETLVYEELIMPRIPYSVSKDHASVNDTYIGINWKKRFPNVDYATLRDFALLIHTKDRYITDKDTGASIDFIGEKNTAWKLEIGEVDTLAGLRDPKNLLKHVGSFRSSTTPVGITYIFKDNTETDVFPVTGFRYETENANFPITNEKGLCTTRSWQYWSDPSKGICIMLDFTFAAELYDADPTLFEDLIGFRIVMGDRLDNFIGQGILIPGYDSWMCDENDSTEHKRVGFGQENRYDKNEACTIPLIDGAYPYMIQHQQDGGDEYWHYVYTLERYKAGGGVGYNGVINKVDPVEEVDNGSEFKRRYAMRSGYETTEGDPSSFVANKYGLFIPDLMFEMNVSIPDETHLQPVMKVVPFYNGDNEKGPFYSFDPWPIMPRYVGFDLDHKVVDSQTSAKLIQPVTTKDTLSVKSYLVDRFVSRGPAKFSSYQPAGFTLEGESFDRFSTTSAAMIHRRYNRSFALSRYIGIVDDGGKNALEQFLYNVVNLFKMDPTQFAIDAEGTFTVFNTIYRPVTEKISFTDIAPHPLAEVQINALHGDCFHQKTFFRLGRWYGYEKPAVNVDVIDAESQGGEWCDRDGNRYQYGTFIGLIHEGRRNLTYRNEVVTQNEKFEELTYSFMPKCFTFFKSTMQWLVMDDSSGVHEAFQINDGYNYVKTQKIYFGYNEQMVGIHDSKRPNRAYHSAKDISGSFVDNFRDIRFSNYRDMNSLGGEMVAIRVLGDIPIIIQKNEIIRIIVDERVVQQSDDTQEEFLLAKSREFISEKFEKLGKMGSQHNSSILLSPHGIYGVDWIRRKLWMIAATEQGLSVKDMALEMGIQEELKTFFDLSSPFFNVSNLLPDVPLMFQGIVTGYDPTHKEVYFTFLTPSEFRTYVFAERLQAFKGTVNFNSPFYLCINDSLFSIGFYFEGREWYATNQFYKHDDEDNPLNFYGTDNDLVLSFIVNGLHSDKNYANFRKIFEALFIDMPEIDLKTIYYETQLQNGTYTFKTKTNDLTNTFWEHSEYLEHQWEVPVIVQVSATEGDFQNNSEFLGKWLKVTITYQPGAERKEFFIRNVVSKFEISYQ